MSSLLYLYSGIQEAVRLSDGLFTILRGNSVLREVNSHGMSEFHVKLYSLPYLFPPSFAVYFQNSKDNEHFILEAAVKVSLIVNLGPFSP